MAAASSSSAATVVVHVAPPAEKSPPAILSKIFSTEKSFKSRDKTYQCRFLDGDVGTTTFIATTDPMALSGKPGTPL
jgi:hypothetical protein